jgi:aryl-phospho-beta-D-glucosidase BglC (GH1 family)
MKRQILTVLFITCLFATLFVTQVSATSLLALHVTGNVIKDSLGTTVVLKGVNVPGFTGDSDSDWMGSSTWSESNVHAELAIIKSWGCNVIRLPIAVDLWKFNLSNGGQYMQYALDRVLTIAEEEGLYVIVEPHHLKSDASYSPRTSGYQNPLPYPPYQGDDGLGTDFSTIIADEADWVAFMVDISSKLKTHNNMIFAMWNEPQDQGGSSLTDYYDVCQDCITAMRSAGVTNLILVMGVTWGSPYIDLQYPSSEYGLRWFSVANFVDSTGNLVIDAHNYRGHIHYGATNSYLLTDLNSGLNSMDFYNQTYPILVSEIGGNNANMANDATEESQYFDNMLSLFDAHGISYTAWAFWDVTSYMLHNGYPSATPTVAGVILQNHLATEPEPTPTPSPTPAPSATGTPTTTPIPTATPYISTAQAATNQVFTNVYIALSIAVVSTLIAGCYIIIAAFNSGNGNARFGVGLVIVSIIEVVIGVVVVSAFQGSMGTVGINLLSFKGINLIYGII